MMVFQKSNKDCTLQIRISKEQKEIIRQLASENNKTVSDFILYLVQNYYDSKK